MKNLRTIILSAMVTGVLVIPAVSATADNKDGKEYSHSKWKGDHGRRTATTDGIIADDMTITTRRDVRHDNRGHHNKPEIRQDFKDIRNARNEVKQGRQELRGDHQELRKDRAELRRDIRNGASKEEIHRDRQEIHGDLKEIRSDRSRPSTRPDTAGISPSRA